MIYVALAAALWAVADILENENFFSSRFSKLSQKFWYKRESWKHAKKVFNYKIDAWHLAKSAIVVLFILQGASGIVDFLAKGILFNLVFNLSYKWLKSGRRD